MLTLDETRLRRQVEAAVERLDAANTEASRIYARQ
jgi:hypothetical protein